MCREQIRGSWHIDYVFILYFSGVARKKYFMEADVGVAREDIRERDVISTNKSISSQSIKRSEFSKVAKVIKLPLGPLVSG